MVKKKRHSDPMRDESTESCEEDPLINNQGANSGECPHIKKSVDPSRIRKKFKITSFQSGKCSSCDKKDEENVDDAKRTDAIENDIWLCLKCGSLLCGRSTQKHALKHFQVARSEPHALAMNITTYDIWCYECEDKINPSARRNLLECVEFIKKLPQKLPINDNQDDNPKVANIETKVQVAYNLVEGVLNDLSTKQQMNPIVNGLPVPGFARRVQSIDAFPRVRGLSNIGNTCYFNSVLQNLAQTPFLLEVLKEASVAGEEFVLPGGTFTFNNGIETELPAIQGILNTWGGLTAALVDLLEELQCEGEGNVSVKELILRMSETAGPVFSPYKLFNKLTAKCRQFEGGDQHDTHELLRHLLESVRAEDLQRYQKIILASLGYKGEGINMVGEEMKQKCKIYGQQAADRILRPEQVFRGFLVSTLTCQECFHSSSCHESFLDISIPLSVEKPPPPTRRKASPDEPATNQNKHQLRKEKERKSKRLEKQQARKHDIKSKDSVIDETETVTAIISYETNSNSRTSESSSAEQSDADVEDNLTDDLPKFVDCNQLPNRNIPTLFDSNGNNEIPSPVAFEKEGDSPENLNKTWSSLSTSDDNDSGLGSNKHKTKKGKIQSLTEKTETNNYNVENDKQTELDKFILKSEQELKSMNDQSKKCSQPQISDNSDENDISDEIKAENKSTGLDTEKLDKFDDGNGSSNLVLKIGISEEGANLIKQRTQKSFDEYVIIDKLPSAMENLNLDKQDNVPENNRQNRRRPRTYSHSDWTTTMAPRYQCEDGECSVQSCLNNFTGVELMTGFNKVGCDNCTKNHGMENSGKMIYTNATKQFLISSPPAVLILHLKRFQMDARFLLRKLTRTVTFPLVLDIAPYCGSKVKMLPNVNRNQKKLLYALYGVVEHSGSMHGGHYTAYVKVREKLKMDDPRWKFLPNGSKAELDQTDEQVAKLEASLAKERAARAIRAAREQCMKTNDSDDVTVLNSNCSTETDDGGAEGGKLNGNEEDLNGLAPPGKWYYVSDSRVTQVSEATVLRSQAYLLFYERIY